MCFFAWYIWSLPNDGEGMTACQFRILECFLTHASHIVISTNYGKFHHHKIVSSTLSIPLYYQCALEQRVTDIKANIET